MRNQLIVRSVIGLAAACVVAMCALAVVTSESPVAAQAPGPLHLQQGWDAAEWQRFYTTTQGSRLIDYAWFKSLERPDSTDKLLDPVRGLERFHYLPNPAPGNPEGLPVGFTLDRGRNGGRPWLGMTCAACHTSQIEYQGRTWQIDGGPTDADLFGFLEELSGALTATANDGAKFSRFAISAAAPGESQEQLRERLKQFATRFSDFIRASKPDVEWGPARADAFGMIFNRVAGYHLGQPALVKQASAPVSYPFLWGTSAHDLVQWNGSAPNRTATGRLARNVGEVTGVFADLELSPPTSSRRYYASSAALLNLLRLDQSILRLKSPKWPAEFGPIQPARYARGVVLYTRYCGSCHHHPQALNRNVVQMVPLGKIGTDPAMAEAPRKYWDQTATGRLEGAPRWVLGGSPLRATEPINVLLINVIAGSILNPLPETDNPFDGSLQGRNLLLGATLKLRSQAGGLATDAQREQVHRFRKELITQLSERLKAADSDQPAYKARSLDGIWATAPYLHNGSVATLYDLLLPEAQRPKTIYVGSRRFDPVNVGFESGPSSGGRALDTGLPGNSNRGHSGKAYGTNLGGEDRRALIEFLKTL